MVEARGPRTMGYINAVRRNFKNSNLCESFYIVIVRLLPGKVVRSRTSGYRDTGPGQYLMYSTRIFNTSI